MLEMTQTTAMDSTHPYDSLVPDVILDSVESVGLRCDGRFLALNSFENRVYQVGLEDRDPVIVKFYRPGRWADEAILEEHEFTRTLAELEIPVVAPLLLRQVLRQDEPGLKATGPLQSLHHFHGFRFAVYPRRGGHWPDLDHPDHFRWLGRFLGRIHQLGAAKPFRYRPLIDCRSFGRESYEFLLASGFIPQDLRQSYSSVVGHVLDQVEQVYPRHPAGFIRLHGDCHPGNILWTDSGPHFVDFDDARMGPAVQDLWMLLSGQREEMSQQLTYILEGYNDFARFNSAEIALIEPLRSLRLIHYNAWLARRWTDPAFPKNFPWFNTPRYWEEHILNLKEQLSALQEEPLSVVL